MADFLSGVTVITSDGTFTGDLTVDDDGTDIVALPMDNVMLGPTPCHGCGEPVIWRTGATVAMMPGTYVPHVAECLCVNPPHEDGCPQTFHLKGTGGVAWRSRELARMSPLCMDCTNGHGADDAAEA